MARLTAKVNQTLNENRILILGTQIFLGFQLQWFFQPGFEKFSENSQLLSALAFGLIALTIGILLWPAAYHQIVQLGKSKDGVLDLTKISISLSLLILAFVFGLVFYLVSQFIAGFKGELYLGIGAGLTALFFWHGIVLAQRRKRKVMKTHHSEPTSVTDKVDHILTEARMILPGAQALLGFQFTAILTPSFEQLPSLSQQVHLVSLSIIALTTILLMALAAYHRLVERGEDTEHFYKVASYFVLAAMVLLALGICTEFYIIIHKVTHSFNFALTSSLILLFFYYGCWFGLTCYKRCKKIKN